MSDHHEHLWYDLFSRGARDWLRHNAKIRSSVREQLPRLIAGADILSTDANRKVRMPVRFLEHYRFKLSQDQEQSGVGQGKVDYARIVTILERHGYNRALTVALVNAK